MTTWFQDREIGAENFTDNTSIFRKVYKQIFLQRTRQALREAMPELNVYARRQAEWLPVEFEPATEKALVLRQDKELGLPIGLKSARLEEAIW